MSEEKGRKDNNVPATTRTPAVMSESKDIKMNQSSHLSPDFSFNLV